MKEDEQDTADVETEEKDGVKGDEDTADAAVETEEKAADDTATAIPTESQDADEAAFNDVIKAATSPSPDAVESPSTVSPPSADQEGPSSTPASTSRGARHSTRQPSVSIQSKIRSTSFRDGGPLSPALVTPSGLSRPEELERENKRLAREAEEHEKRWRRVEEELEELREQNAETSVSGGAQAADADGEIQRLKAEIETLRRKTSTARKESTQNGADDVESLKTELESKDSTIADMQLEISRLRGQLSSQTEGCETHGEQISALESSLSSVEGKLRGAESQLADTKKALSRASEKAVLDGTERTSKDTKIRSLERELEDAIVKRDEVVKKAEQLDKKVEAMNKLHREAESRNSTKLATSEATARELPALRARVEKLESENSRLREKHKRVMSGGGGDEGLDELEDEERQKLEKKIRELEAQVFDLQRGVWRDKRIQMQSRGDEGSRTSIEAGEDFDDVDLSGSGNASRRRSSGNLLHHQSQARHSGFTQVLNSGLAAFRTSTTSPDSQSRHQNRPRNDSLLQEFDDDDGFDENAFARAQAEEEARKMVEHVREVKRGLKDQVGWRLDLVDARRASGGVGFGDIFDV